MPRVSAEAGNVLALQLGVNVTQMFAEIVGLGTVIHLCIILTASTLVIRKVLINGQLLNKIDGSSFTAGSTWY